VSGTVYNSRGAPVAGVIISAKIPGGNGGSFLEKATTDDDGRFTIDRLYTPIIERPNHESAVVEFWNPERTEAHVVELPPWDPQIGTQDRQLDIHLAPLRSISGRIIDATTMEGVTGMRIRTYRKDIMHGVVMGTSTRSDDFGRFRLSGIIPGCKHTLTADDDVINPHVINRPFRFEGKNVEVDDLGNIIVHEPVPTR
jgi:hypothetical protein